MGDALSIAGVDIAEVGQYQITATYLKEPLDDPPKLRALG